MTLDPYLTLGLGGLLGAVGWAGRTVLGRLMSAEKDIVALQIQAGTAAEANKNTTAQLDEVKAELSTIQSTMARREDLTELTKQVAALGRRARRA